MRIEHFDELVDKPTLKIIVGFLVSLFFLHVVYSLSVMNVHEKYLEQVKTQVTKRVALDLPTIPLERDWINEVGNPEEVASYVASLNKYIETQEWPYSVKQITNYQPNDNEYYEVLNTIGQDVYVVFKENKELDWHGFTPLTLLLAIGFASLIYMRQNAKAAITIIPDEVINSPLLLTIDLKNKLLVNPKTNKTTELSNKPLCFYSALVDYCLANPDCKLSSNKQLPEEFLVLAQKYFYRLIELGHTIRKRPNFENNLDKTLSEIRAGLDDVLGSDIFAKEILIPPKAIGEGSRSKVHSFCLTKLKQEVIEITGK